ncbi:MAG TPA: DUF4359 domain-containing protein [Nitrospiraceae bacterium]|nr:DUF4359 domain-containing protein [Nitrospiraceae bacterium]
MKISNTLLVILVGLLTVCVILAATNPTTDQYGRFLDTQLTKALARMKPDDANLQQKIMRDILTTQGKKVIDSLTRSNTVRRDYGLFSLFTTRVFQVEIAVVGVGTQFIPLDSQEELIKKLGRLML